VLGQLLEIHRKYDIFLHKVAQFNLFQEIVQPTLPWNKVGSVLQHVTNSDTVTGHDCNSYNKYKNRSALRSNTTFQLLEDLGHLTPQPFSRPDLLHLLKPKHPNLEPSNNSLSQLAVLSVHGFLESFSKCALIPCFSYHGKQILHVKNNPKALGNFIV
jgi:hypothetical protein